MNYLVSKLQWKSSPVEVYIYLTNLNTGDIEKRKLEVGDTFNIRVGKGKFCVGAAMGEWVSCMHNTGQDKPNMVFTGNQCSTCNRSDMYNCRRTCIGIICLPSSPEVKELCQPAKTTVYLTDVGGVFKVGVSINHIRRWVEQGSDYGYQVAELPGLEARAVEQLISKDLGVRQQVGSKRKFEFIVPRGDSEFRNFITEVLPSVEAIYNEVVGKSKIKGIFFRDGKIVDLSQYYGRVKEIDRLQEFEIVEGAEFGGEIIGVKGAYLIVKSGIYYYTVSMRKLAGYEIDFIDQAQNKGQSSLDEWF